MDEKRRILFVDDEPGTVMAVQKRLELAGFDVLTAMDGEEALIKARNLRPDLIVLDLQLPKLSGLKVCTMLKQDPLYQQIPIIILTGKEEVVDERACRACGADAYLTKSSGTPALIDRITELLPTR